MPDGNLACPRCGQPAQPGSQFCESCGSPLQLTGDGAGRQPVAPAPWPPQPSSRFPGRAEPPVSTPPVAAAPRAWGDGPEQPPSGPEYPTSGPPGYGHRRLNPMGVGGSLAAVVVVAVVAGVVVPKIVDHPPVPNVGPAGTTTVAGTAPASTAPPATAPVTTAPVTTAPASTAPATTMPARTTGTTTAPATTAPATTAPATTAPATTGAPGTTVPGGQGASTGAGRALSNGVVSVVVPAGWGESSNSSNTDLFLLGPSGLALELFTEQVQAATTITDVFQSELVQRQKSSPDAQVCENTTPATLPGTPAVSGYYQGVCFTLTPQNGPSTPYEDASFAGLVPGSSGSLLLQESVYAPRSMTSAVLKQDVVPVLRTVHWRQTSGS